MRRNARKKQPPSRLLPIVVFLLAALLVVGTVGKRSFSLGQQLGLEAVGLVQVFAHRFGATVHGWWQDYIALVNVAEENKRLRTEITALKLKLAEQKEAAATAIALRQLLHFRDRRQPGALAADVVGRDPSLFFRSLVVDRGRNHGVTPGMPVVTGDGVVGQVIEATPHVAKVLLAIDPNSAIDALDQRSRVQGILKGDQQGYTMEYVLKNADIQPGDTIVTAGLNGLFPKGLVLGTVVAVSQPPRGMFQEITVAPAVDFRRLETVLLLPTATPLTPEDRLP